MLEAVDTVLPKKATLLLIDTCAEAAGVALSSGEQVRETETLAPRAASAEIVCTVRRLLQRVEWTLADVNAVGVVNGPGSFTGVRAGLAAAKGLCEARGLALAAVSRLEVLAAAGRERLRALGDSSPAREAVLAVLDAGRGEVYVREEGDAIPAREWLCRIEELRDRAGGRPLIVAEERVAESLAGCDLILRPLLIEDALPPVLRCLHEGGSDVATVDANYVRGERDIYRTPLPDPSRNRGQPAKSGIEGG